MKSKFVTWVYALFALYLRYTLGMIFWLSGQSKVDGWQIKDSTYWLFENEYALPLIPSDIAAIMGTAAEHILPLMLFIGLGTRFGALGLLAMTAVIQIFVYPEEYMLHGYWAAMAILLTYLGGGKLSVDAIIAHFSKTTFPEWLRRKVLKR